MRRTLEALFRAQAREIVSRLSIQTLETGELPDISYWMRTYVEAVRPAMLQQFQTGMLRTAANLGMRVTPQGQEPPMRNYVLTTGDIFHGRGQKQLAKFTRMVTKEQDQNPFSMAFDLFNPKVLDAVDRASFRFCQETNDTATADLEKAIAKLRKEMKAGLSRGEALTILARRVGQIFADPYRAFRIAATETSRAVHGGQLIAAKMTPAVVAKVWLASVDACEQCMDIDGKSVPLDEPFYVDPKGGPYASVMTPPLHPQCMCTMTEEI